MAVYVMRLFKPAWQSNNNQKRLKAVENLGHDSN
jgi:hypothetical protein